MSSLTPSAAHSEKYHCTNEWILAEDRLAYQHIQELIRKNPNSAAIKIIAYLQMLLKSQQRRLGSQSFVSPVSSHPMKGTNLPSLLMLACQSGVDKLSISLLNKFGEHIPVSYTEWSTLDGVKTLMSPLHVAVAKGARGTVRLLLQTGADVNTRTCCLETPLHIAARMALHRTVKLLLDSGADVKTLDRFGNTPLLAAMPNSDYASKALLKTIKLILSRDASLTRTNKRGCTAMHLAAGNSNLQIVKLLLLHVDRKSMLHGSQISLQPPPVYLVGSMGPGIVQNSEKTLLTLLQAMEDSTSEISSRINAFLLFGALQNRPLWLKYWRVALTLREQHRNLPADTREEFNSRKEMSTLQDLDRLMQSDLECKYQSLIIRRRCLGPESLCQEDTLALLRNVVEINGKNSKELLLHFSNVCEEVWTNFPCSLESEVGVGIVHFIRALHQLTKDISNMMSSGLVPSFKHYVSQVLQGMEVLCKLNEQHACQRAHQTQLYSKCFAAILNLFAMWINQSHEMQCEDLECLEIAEAGRTFISKFSLLANKPLLHIILDLNPTTHQIPSHLQLLPTILDWGAYEELNVQDQNGYTPLHKAIVLANKAPDTQLNTCIAVVSSMLECGAHVDTVAQTGETALEMCKRQEVRNLFLGPAPLACLTARAVVAEHIPYRELNLVPPQVKAFISFHDAA